MNLTTIIGGKVKCALKVAGIAVHQFSIHQVRPGEFQIAAVITNDAPIVPEEEPCVIKKDYRLKQIEETDQRQTQE